MSCRNHVSNAKHISNQQGCSSVGSPSKEVITYKYLELTPDRKFMSPVSEVVWENGTCSGDAIDEENRADWVWSCDSPDNPELAQYRSRFNVLVTLQVWGDVVYGDNGVIRSQHARIIGYDSDDYYFALFCHGQLTIQQLNSLLTPNSPHRREAKMMIAQLVEDKNQLLKLYLHEKDPEIKRIISRKLIEKIDKKRVDELSFKALLVYAPESADRLIEETIQKAIKKSLEKSKAPTH